MYDKIASDVNRIFNYTSIEGLDPQDIEDYLRNGDKGILWDREIELIEDLLKLYL